MNTRSEGRCLVPSQALSVENTDHVVEITPGSSRPSETAAVSTIAMNSTTQDVSSQKPSSEPLILMSLPDGQPVFGTRLHDSEAASDETGLERLVGNGQDMQPGIFGMASRMDVEYGGRR